VVIQFVTKPQLGKPIKILYLVTEDWYFLSHRLALARACRDRGWDVAVATRVGEYRAEIEKEGFSVINLRMRRRGRNALAELRSIVELVGILRRERPDIIHNVGLKPVIYGSFAALVTRTVPVVNTLAGMGHVFSAGHLAIKLARFAVKLSLKPCLRAKNHWLIVQNKVDAEVMTAGRLAPKGRTEIVRGSGVDIEHFTPAPEPDGPIIAAIVSRMLKDKGVREVVLAARELKCRNVGVEIWLVGDPDMENPSSLTEEDLCQWNAEGCIHWLGHKTDIAAIWARAHIALLPSYREGMPMALLEAAASGRPIITSDVPGCNELVINGETGLLVPSNEWVGIADAIQQLAGSSDLRAKLGAAAREKVSGEYEQDNIVRTTHALYSRALTQSGRDISVYV
jgi:glycosyltransferase involved in cell wall biosynthesis